MARNTGTIVVALGVSLAVAGCTPGTSNSTGAAAEETAAIGAKPPRLLTYPTRPGQVFQATGLQGVLAIEDGCIVFKAVGKSLLAYFPQATARLDATSGTLTLNGAPVPFGVPIDVMGSIVPGKSDASGVSDPGVCDARELLFVTPAAIRRM